MDYCDHLHKNVTQNRCSLCWLRGEGDPDKYLVRRSEWTTRDVAFQGWDACRAKHIKQVCPECGAPVIHEGGCWVCPACGASGCG